MFLTQAIYSQGFINLNKRGVKKILSKYIDREKLHCIIKESDNVIDFKVRDSSVQNLDLTLHFNQTGKCFSETRVLNCDSCFNKILKDVLDKKEWGWKPVNSTTFLSKFSKHLLLSIAAEKSFSYEIKRIDLNKDEYERQIKDQN